MGTVHWTARARQKHGTWVRMSTPGAYGMVSQDGQFIFHAVKHPKVGWNLHVYRASWQHFKSDGVTMLLHGPEVAVTATDTLRDAKGIAAVFGPRRGAMEPMTTAVVDYYDSLK